MNIYARLILLCLVPSSALAAPLDPNDPFIAFAVQVISWSQGPMGKGLAVLGFLLGTMAALGVNASGSSKWQGHTGGAFFIGLFLALILSKGPLLIANMFGLDALIP